SERKGRCVMARRVVVTGMGVVTPVGNSVAATWEALKAGTSGVAPITKFDASKFPVRFAAEVKDFNPGEYMERKEVKRSDVYTQYAVAAAKMAMSDAGLSDPAAAGIDPDRIGVIIGSGIGGLKSFEEQHDVYRELGPSKISPFFIPMFIADIAAGIVSMQFNAKGPNYATVSACATSAHAIGDAYRTIQYGDGFVMGEGAGIVILEELEHARERGATIYAEIVGYGATGDAYHLTAPAPDGEGAQRAMKRAMRDAKLEPGDIQYINAHGTSTPANDLNETRAIKAVFGEHAKGLN